MEDRSSDIKEVSLKLTLSVSTLEKIDSLVSEWGLRNRAEVIQRILDEVFLGT